MTMSSKTWKQPLAPAPDSNSPNSGNYPLTRAKKATTACEACQKRKSKCIGGEPCNPCQKSNTECKVNAENDGRRRITLKRKIEALELDRDLLVRLVEVIRNDSDRQASDVLSLIRSNAPLDEIRLLLADTQHNARAKLLRHSPKRYMDVKRIADIPLFEVPAQPWTIITDDDAFVSHLISLYFTWQNPIMNWIDRDLFLANMRSGRLDSRFCSPLLVNSILAVACFYSDYPETYAVPGDPQSRGDHFFQEALALLQKEEGRLSLTTLQARGEIYTSACVRGKDRVGWQYLVEISDCIRQVLRRRHKMIAEANEQGEQMARSIDTAMFGLFSLNPVATLSFQKPSLIKRPQVERFPENHHPNDTWVPYPRQAEPIPAHTNCILNGQFELASVSWEISDYLFGDERPASIDPERINSFHSRLEKGTASLPECIRLGNMPTPGALELHMRYYNVKLIMFGFITPSLQESDPATKERIKSLRMSSAHQIGTILNRLRSHWPIECIPVASMQYATIALFTLLDDMEDERNKIIFVDLLMTLRALARRWPLAKGMLRLVQLTAIRQGIPLPRETMVLFKDFETEMWKTGDRERFSSLYPNFAVSVNQRGVYEGADEVEMDRFLDEWDNLDLSGKCSDDESRDGIKCSADSYDIGIKAEKD